VSASGLVPVDRQVPNIDQGDNKNAAGAGQVVCIFYAQQSQYHPALATSLLKSMTQIAQANTQVPTFFEASRHFVPLPSNYFKSVFQCPTAAGA
jgi:hypothetical protein